MGIPLANIRKDYEGELQVHCPNCKSVQYQLDKTDVGLHECEECNEAFKIADLSTDTSNLKESLSDLESEIRWLKDRVSALEHQLGLDK